MGRQKPRLLICHYLKLSFIGKTILVNDKTKIYYNGQLKTVKINLAVKDIARW